MVINTDAFTILKSGKITVRGEFLWGSNYTFLVDVAYRDHTLTGVYKPTRGERPLWDFPAASLAKREVAAYLVSEVLGWRLVPETVYRKDGPLGPGSVQLFIDHDPNYHYFNFQDEDLQNLRPAALFDLLINNADRKGSHILRDEEGHLWLIDHGVCFHVEDKLRTVIWDFVGESIPEDLRRDVKHFQQEIELTNGSLTESGASLLNYLSQAEVRALIARAKKLSGEDCFPPPDSYRRAFPWPQI